MSVTDAQLSVHLDRCLPVFFSSRSYLVGGDADEELCAVCFSCRREHISWCLGSWGELRFLGKRRKYELLKLLIPSLSTLKAEAVLVSTHPCRARPQVTR